MINFKAIGQRIKRIRKENGLTQERLAEMLNISTEHLSRIETGSYRPSLSLIEKVSDIFKIEEQIIMFGNGFDKSNDKELCDKIECLSEEKKQAVKLILDLISN
ncbi:MAG: helix-turn-helix transcriptional regulator [Clostridia bacterium]|nr:helix-turn-helix transcriptional regulator [Clostridia bacterium]